MPAISMPRSAVYDAVIRYAGNRSAMHRGMRLSLNTVRRLIALHGLHAMADGVAVEAARPGPRAVDEEADMGRVVAALSVAPVAEAAALLGVSPATLYRRMARYGITRAELTALREAPPPA